MTLGEIDCIGVACIPLARDGKSVNYIGASGNVDFDKNGDPTDVLYEVFNISGDTTTIVGTIRP